jgi:aspartyl aminopeptidase
VGRSDTTDGRTVEVSVGLRPGDPVFVIPDNAPHSDSELRNRTYTNVLQGEELDPVAGSIPGGKDSVAVEVVKLLTSTLRSSRLTPMTASTRFFRALRSLRTPRGWATEWP